MRAQSWAKTRNVTVVHEVQQCGGRLEECASGRACRLELGASVHLVDSVEIRRPQESPDAGPQRFRLIRGDHATSHVQQHDREAVVVRRGVGRFAGAEVLANPPLRLMPIKPIRRAGARAGSWDSRAAACSM